MARAVRFDEPEPRTARQLFAERRPARPAMPLDMLPVIHSGALELAVVELETQWFDQVQRRLRRRAKPRHVACVRRNFRFNQNDVHDSKLQIPNPKLQRITKLQAPKAWQAFQK